MTTSNKIGYSAEVLTDSVSTAGARLTTMVVTFPRMILSEFNTHNALSKNSASSRARPVMKVIEEVLHSPFIPDKIGRNKSGMQASTYLEEPYLSQLQKQILVKRDRAVLGVFEDLLSSEIVRKLIGPSNYAEYMISGLQDDKEFIFNILRTFYQDRLKDEDPEKSLAQGFLNPHKQTVNRYLEPFLWHTVVVTATEWDNFYGLRCDNNAAPEINKIAWLMRRAMDESVPVELNRNQWHLPFLYKNEKAEAANNIVYWLGVSAGRCARVSYVNHFGKRDPDLDFNLANSLLGNGHMSPFEHIARPTEQLHYQSGNLVGWEQLRKLLPNEDDFSKRDDNLVDLRNIIV